MNANPGTTLTLEKPSRDNLDQILAAIAETVDEFGRQHNWNDQTGFRVNLVLEELATNTINHGTPEGTEAADVTIRLNHGQDEVSLTYCDQGVAFNPLTEAPEPTLAMAGDLQVGGIGIELIKRMTNSLEYTRDNDRNQLTMTLLRNAPDIDP